MKWILVLVIPALLAGCGFQLRSEDITAVDELAIAGAGAAPATFRSLTTLLESRGVQTSSESMDAFNVRLLDERTIRRAVATTSIIDTADYELRLEVDLAMSRGDDQLISDTLAVQRIYSVDAVNLSGSTEEQRLLLGEMHDEMAHRIIRRIEILSRVP